METQTDDIMAACHEQEPATGPESAAAEQSADAAAMAAENQEPHEEDELPMTQERLEQLLAEAEHRGYLRGRNEKIELMMEAPSLWRSTSDADRDELPEPEPVILANLRPSVWNS